MRKMVLAAVAALIIPLPASTLSISDVQRGYPCYAPVCVKPSKLPVLPPVPIVQTVYAPGVEQWRTMVAYFWPAEHVDSMLTIMACESGGDPYADNPTSSAAGLFQIMGFWQTVWPGNYYDPWTNAAVAYQIWLVQGYDAWVCKA